jgi:hypothetical protein
MLEISTVGMRGLDQVLEHMQEDLHNFSRGPMTDEFVNWQVEDVHRKWPYYTNPKRQVKTWIWPRGVGRARHKLILSVKAGRKPRLNRGYIRATTMLKKKVSLGGRPILRDELMDSLIARMGQLMAEKLKWR